MDRVLLMTYSIVALDRASGQVGMAIHSRAFGVRRVARYVRPGVGAVATQALVLPAHGARTIESMARGTAPDDALDASLALDDGRELRQVIAIDVRGRTAGHTGRSCIASASHIAGADFVVAGNILANDTVVPAMAEVAAGDHPSLPQRLLAVLRAADEAGGDLRGRQSAAMVVAGPEDTGDPLADLLVEVGVDDDPAPLEELARLVDLAGAHHELDLADAHLAGGRVDEAADTYVRALGQLGGDPEFHVWAACALAEAGEQEQARRLIASVRERADADRWEALSLRLVGAGLLDGAVHAAWWDPGG